MPKLVSVWSSWSLAGGNVKDGTVSSEGSWQSLTKLNILLPYDPAIAFLGMYPNELKTYVHTETCTQMFTLTLLK